MQQSSASMSRQDSMRPRAGRNAQRAQLGERDAPLDRSIFARDEDRVQFVKGAFSAEDVEGD
jgi:hypothetical protein